MRGIKLASFADAVLARAASNFYPGIGRSFERGGGILVARSSRLRARRDSVSTANVIIRFSPVGETPVEVTLRPIAGRQKDRSAAASSRIHAVNRARIRFGNKPEATLLRTNKGAMS